MNIITRKILSKLGMDFCFACKKILYEKRYYIGWDLEQLKYKQYMVCKKCYDKHARYRELIFNKTMKAYEQIIEKDIEKIRN